MDIDSIKATFIGAALVGVLIVHALARWGRVPALTSFILAQTLVLAIVGVVL